METESPLIFISYTTADRDRVVPFYNYLVSKGFDLWMDLHRLKPGQNWDFEIKRSLNKASIILLFVSENSITKRGYVQREVKASLDRLNEKLVDDIYLIPILLDDYAPIPDELKNVQFTRASSEGCEAEIEDSILHQLKQVGQNIQSAQSLSSVAWSKSVYKDIWDGIPGVQIEFQLWHFRSDDYPKSSEITDHIKGYFIGEAMDFRSDIFDPVPDVYNFGQERYRRTHTFDAACSEPHIVGKVMSLNYAVHTYYAGAAHPNMTFQTFSFILDPLIRIKDPCLIFHDSGTAFGIIQTETRKLLAAKQALIDGDEEVVIEPDNDWVDRGTETWQHFNSFIFKEDGIEFLFSPYQVASYAEGPQSAEIPYAMLVNHMRPLYIGALGKDFSYINYDKFEAKSISESDLDIADGDT